MKKILTISFASFFVPFWIFIAILHSSLPHIYYTSIMAHSALLLVICSIAFSTCYFYYMNYVKNEDVSFFVVALFFWIIGLTLFLHAITIQNFYFLNEHIFDITEHIGLFLSGLVLLALFVPSPFARGLFYDNRKKILVFCAMALLASFVILVFFPEATEVFSGYINVFIFASGVLLFVGTVALLQKRVTLAEHASFPYAIACLSILINAAIVPFFYKGWNILWWYFHIVILCAELVIFIGILKCNKGSPRQADGVLSELAPLVLSRDKSRGIYLYFVVVPPAIARLFLAERYRQWRAGRTLCTRILVHALPNQLIRVLDIGPAE